MSRKIDVLFECIQYVCELDATPIPNVNVLESILCGDDALDPKTAITLLNRIGYECDLQNATRHDLLALSRSDIIVLKDNKAAVVHSVIEGETLRLMIPGEDRLQQMSVDEVMAIFAGYRFNISRKAAKAYDDNFSAEGQKFWFFSTIRRISYTYPHIFIASVIINLLLFVVPLYIMNVYDRVVPTGASDTLLAFATGAIILLTFDFILRSLRGSLMNRVTSQIDSEMSKGLYDQVLNLKISSHKLTPGGYIELAKEIREMRKFFANATLTTLVDIPFTLLFIFGVYFVAGSLVWVLIIAVILVAAVNLILQPMVNKSERSFVKYNSIIQSLTLEAYTGIETVKSLAAESVFERKYIEAGSTVQASDRYRLLTNLVNNLNLYIKNLSVISLVFFGSKMIFALDLTMGQLVAAVMIGSRAMMVDHVSNVVSRINRMRDAVINLSLFMNLPREYDGSKTYVMKSDLSGSIEIKDLSFQYESAKFPAIDHLSFSISAREHVALVGHVGSGKSTLVKCIVNLLDPSRGQIQLDGIDNTEIDPVMLRRQVHYMSSENYIFKGSVIENVRVADPAAAMEKVLRVMDDIGIMRFVKDHPKGVDMPILDGGVNLSTGQRQSIAIARAMLSPAKVLLLDEPTSFCDLEMSAVFMQRLVAACQDKTIIFITHRLSLCQFMHRVVEMKKGRIIKDGLPKDIIPALVEEARIHHLNSGKSYE